MPERRFAVPDLPVDLAVAYDGGYVWRLTSLASGKVLDGSSAPLPSLLDLIHAVSPYGRIPLAVIEQLTHDAEGIDGGP